MKQKEYCSIICPYLLKTPKSLKPRLPFFCDLYQVFLGVENEKVCRCELCLGRSLNAVKDGYHLISTYPDSGIDKRKTKWGFRRLPLSQKDRFVRLVEKFGVTMGVGKNMSLNTVQMLTVLGKQMDELTPESDVFKTAQDQSFGTLLNKLAEDLPRLMTPETKQLLLNLFAVLDNSEKALMAQVLGNGDRVVGFVKEVTKIPKGDNLLKDVRRLLMEEEAKMAQEEERRKLLMMRAVQSRGGR